MGKATAFLDVFLNSLLIFVLLFVLSFMQITEKQKEYKRPPVEYLIQTEWPDGYKSDVDIWMLNPTKNLLWYMERDLKVIVLDRDDRGSVNACEIIDGKEVCDKQNREVLTIRTKLPGRYLINIHLFKHRDFAPVPVKVTMDKMNPTVVRIAEKTITLTEEWQQEMFIHFEITESGDIIILDPIDEDLVSQKITQQGGRIL